MGKMGVRAQYHPSRDDRVSLRIIRTTDASRHLSYWVSGNYFVWEDNTRLGIFFCVLYVLGARCAPYSKYGIICLIQVCVQVFIPHNNINNDGLNHWAEAIIINIILGDEHLKHPLLIDNTVIDP